MSKSIKVYYENMVVAAVLLVTFLLPVKFGGLVGLPETTGYFPESGFAWLIITWPVASFSFFAGLLLLLVLTGFSFKNTNQKAPIFITAVLWTLLALVAIIGAINASVLDYPIVEVVHLFGIAAYGISVYLLLAARPELRNWLLTAIFAGAVVTCLLGIEQIFSGFEETRKFVEQQEMQYGIKMSEDLKARIDDDRVFASFASCNSLAGYLLLTIPLCLALCWTACGKIEPVKISRTLFMSLLSILLLVVFFYTKSRGAFLSLVLAGVILVVIFPFFKKLRWAIIFTAPIVVIGGALFIHYSGRGFASMAVRVDYVHSAWKMLLAHPLAGSGWGDFFHDHMTLKVIGSKEAAHTPHNILMAFAAQTGFFGLFACLAAILYPLVSGIKNINLNWRKTKCFPIVRGAMVLGLVAFFLHSLMDVNLQIPGSMASALALLIILVMPETELCASTKTFPLKYALLTGFLALLVALGAASGGYYLTSSEYTFSQLSDLCNLRNKSPEDFQRVSPDEVKDKLLAVAAVRPYSPYPWIVAADFMFSRNYLDTAEDYYKRAVALSPERSYIYHRLYLLQTLQGNNAEAKKNLEMARKLFPRNEDYQREMQIPNQPVYGPVRQ